MKLMTVDETKDLIRPICNEELVESSWSDIKYKEGGKFVSGKREFFLTEGSLHQMLKEVGVSKETFSSVSENLRKGLVEEMLVSKEPFGVLFDRDTGNAKQFVNINIPYVNSLTVFDKVTNLLVAKKLLTPTDGCVQVDVDMAGRVLFNFITHTSHTLKKVGDVIHAGVSIMNRVKDMTPELKIGMFAYTLQCQNGLMHKFEEYELIKAESVDQVYKIIEANVTKMYEESKDVLIPNLMKLNNVTVQDPTRVIHQLSKESSVSGAIKNRLLNRVASLGINPTMYRLVNLVTNEANAFEMDSRIRMQLMGGRIVETVDCRCPNCRSIL